MILKPDNARLILSTAVISLGWLPAAFCQAPLPGAPTGIAVTTRAAAAAKLSPAVTLKLMGESIHRTKVSAVDLIKECQHQENFLAEGGEIDFIGGEVIPIIPATAEGLGPIQYLQPRKRFIDLHMQQLLVLIPILQEDIESIALPPASGGNAAIAANLTAMEGFLKDAGKHYKTLQALTKAPPYDNAAIVAEAGSLHTAVVEIDKLRKASYSTIKSQ